jgi:hypothetical protein
MSEGSSAAGAAITAAFDAVTRPISAHEAVTRPFRIPVPPGRPRLPPPRRVAPRRLGRHAAMWACQVTALAGYVAGVYLAVAVGLGALTSWSPDWRTAMRLAAVAVTAAGFTTVRRRVSATARRLLLPAPSRYEVLAGLAGRLRAAGPIEEALPGLARLLGEGTQAREAAVWLRSGPGFVRAAGWARFGAPGGSPSLRNPDELGQRGDIDAFAAVRDDGELLGALSVALAPGRSPGPPDVQLVTDLANAAGSLLRSTLLTAELAERVRTVSRQAKELHSSRRRLVLARDIARRRLAQEMSVSVQATLTDIRQAMTGVQAEVQEAAGDAERLRQAASQARAVIGAARDQAAALVARFRSVVHGIYPPALSEYGLVTAIESVADGLPRPTRIAARGLGRYPVPLESALYFCAAVALRFLAAREQAVPLRLTLAESGSSLVLTFIDESRSGELGDDERGLLEEMGDHAGAHGGAASATEIGGSLWLQAAVPLPAPAAGRREPASPDPGAGSSPDPGPGSVRKPDPAPAGEAGGTAAAAGPGGTWRRLAGPAFWAGFAAYSAFCAAWLGLGLVTAIAADGPAARHLAARLAAGGHPAWLADVAAVVVAGLP